MTGVQTCALPIFVRGQDNSRMKDFHDLYLLINQKGNEFNDKFTLIIKKVFEHRNSTLVLPLKFRMICGNPLFFKGEMKAIIFLTLKICIVKLYIYKREVFYIKNL